MKIKCITGFLLAGILTVSAATTNELSSALQRGLFEEEPNHNLDAAIQAYQGVINQYDKDRKLAATALFRLGECYRKQNKISDARAQFERVARDFSEQSVLVQQSVVYLGGDTKSSLPTNETERNESSFVTIFNGRDLTGWSFDPNYWSVDEGSITGRAGSGTEPNKSISIWYEKPVGDFELHLQYRFRKMAGNNKASAGINYRALLSSASSYAADGYQYELTLSGDNIGMLSSRSRPSLAVFTSKARIVERPGNSPDKIDLEGELESFSQIASSLKADNWNDVVIIAQGNRLIHKINGHVVADVTDDNTKRRALTGFLGLTLNTGTKPGVYVQFTDIQLKRLDSQKPRVTQLPTIIKSSTNSYFEKFGIELGKLKLQTEAEYQQFRTLLDNLKAIPRAELKQAMPTAYPDPALNELLMSLAVAKATLASLAPDLGREHPEYRKQTAVVQTYETQIDQKVSGMLQGLEVRTASLQSKLKQLDEQIKQLRGGDADSRVLSTDNETIARLQSLRVDATADLLNLKTLLDQLKSMRRADLPQVMATAYPDPRLNELLLNLAQAKAKISSLPDLGKDHPEYAKAAATVQEYEREIDETLNGILRGLETKVAAAQAKVKEFDDQLKQLEDTAPSGSRTAFSQPAVSVGGKSGDAPETDEEAKELRRIQAIVKDSPDLINDVNQTSAGTFLHEAAGEGRLAVARFLLENGAKVDFNKDGATPLHWAALRGHRGVAELLLSKGANPNARNGEAGGTPLLFAVDKNFSAVAELLINKGADVTLAGSPYGANDLRGSTPLHLAAGNGATNLMNLLLTHGAAVNARDDDGRVPLHKAAHTTIAAVELLLKQGADLQATNKTGRTPLHTTASYDRPDIAAELLAKGAQINARTVEGRTPLFEAIKNDKRTMIPFLLEKGADVNIPGDNGKTPLYVAVETKNIDLVRMLLEHHADPNIAAQGASPLHVAVNGSNVPMTEMLLNAHANANALRGRMPLDRMTPLDLLPRPSSQAGEATKTYDQLAQLLKSHGGRTGQEVTRTNFIVAVRNQTVQHVIWDISTNVNEITLLEFCALIDWAQFPFPDLSRISINRINPGSGSTSLVTVDLASILASGDCARDQRLRWGDVITIPMRTDAPNQPWAGLSDEAKKMLDKCLTRSVKIVLGGETNLVTLRPMLQKATVPPLSSDCDVQPAAKKGDPIVIKRDYFFSFMALRCAGLLYTSSDQDHAKVIRRNSVTGRSEEIPFDPKRYFDVWLRDGDVAIIPSAP